MSRYIKIVPGQRGTINHLKKLLQSQRIPHALLFTGPKGIGKHYTAVQFAKELNSSSGELPEFLEKKINRLEEPYIKFICALPRGRSESNRDHPTAKLDNDQVKNINERLELVKSNPYQDAQIEKAQNIKISSIRDLRKYLALDYTEVNKRVVIVHEAHKMSIDSQNALLKNLEEPPEDVVFILHSSSPDLLLSTIKSRCQEIKFSPLNKHDVSKILQEYFKYNQDTAEMVSSFSDGSVYKAIQLIEDDISLFLDGCVNILRYSLARKYHSAFEHFSKLIEKKGSEAFFTSLDLIIKWLLDAVRHRSNLELEYFNEYENTIIKFNNVFGDYDVSSVITSLEKLNSTRQQNINLNICLSNVIFQIGHIGIGK